MCWAADRIAPTLALASNQRNVLASVAMFVRHFENKLAHSNGPIRLHQSITPSRRSFCDTDMCLNALVMRNQPLKFCNASSILYNSANLRTQYLTLTVKSARLAEADLSACHIANR